MRQVKRMVGVVLITMARLGHGARASASPVPWTDVPRRGGLTWAAEENIDFCGPCRAACLVAYGAIDPVKYQDCIDICELYFGSCKDGDALPQAGPRS